MTSFSDLFRGRTVLQLEILALRHQIGVLQRSVKRPKLTPADRALWVWLRSVWKDRRSGIHIVQAPTVVGWHRQGFRMFWIWKIRRRKPQSADLRNCDDAVIIWCLHYRYERRAA